MTIYKVAVLGAGVMGVQIAAHLINADVSVILFDIPATSGNKNDIVIKAIANLKKLKPGPLVVPEKADYIVPANYDEHLDLLKQCDLIIEAVAEKLDIKQNLYRKVAPFISPQAYFVSNTSGLSIKELTEVLPEKIRNHFCGMHFFNPPRYMHLVELIPHATSDRNMLETLENFLAIRLGKGVIIAKDTPNFIANRIGVFSMLSTLFHAQEFNIPLEVVDALTGPIIGRAKSATLRTLDIVGLDTFAHVVNTLTQQLPDDPWAKYYVLPSCLQELINAGALGQKSGKGVYQKKGKDIYVWDIARQDYRLTDEQADKSILDILKIKDAKERLQKLRDSNHPQAQFLAACLRDLFHYCAVIWQEIAHTTFDVDFAIRWGFGWQQGPFELWKSAGWIEIADWLQAEIKQKKMLADVALPSETLKMGDSYFVRAKAPAYLKRQRFPDHHEDFIFDEGKSIFETPAVRAWHDNDGVAVLSFKTKMNTMSAGVLEGIHEAIAYAEKDYKALVIWSRLGEHFSAGANLAEVDLNNAELAVANFQRAVLAVRYANVPVVAAIRGLTLGGACELSLHCDRIVAACETYIGLPEVGVGLLPAGCGSKEMALRASQLFPQDPFLLLQKYFKQMAMAEISTSAEEGKQRHYLRESDVIVMNTFDVLYVAKQHALALSSNYHAPLKPLIPVVGKPGIANFMALLVNMREGGFISDHDYLLASKVAYVLCGGDIEAGSVVNEEWMLRLEREALVELAKTEKTQARIKHMLMTGKPLRN